MAGEDLGSDFAGTDDLDPDLTVVSGLRCLAEALIRRLQTAALFYDPTYGRDLRRFVNGTRSAYDLQRAAEVECLKDERAQRVQASVDFDGSAARLTLVVWTARGPFKLVVAVGDILELLDFVQL